MTYEILTETTSNLPNDIINKCQIRVIPMAYIIDNQSYVCTDIDNFDDKTYYALIKSGKRVTTSQITPFEFIQFMEPFLKEGQDIVFIGLSSGISGTFASAQAARMELMERYPERTICLIDSLGASLGEGMLVIKAAELREQGYAISDLEREITALRNRLYQVFCVDDLMHLRRTGRINIVDALVGSILRFKPLLKGNSEGKIVSFGKYRGKKNIIQAICNKFTALVKNIERIGISYAGCKEDAEYLLGLLRENFTLPEVIMVKHEPATASHLGPGALALYFEGANGVRDL